MDAFLVVELVREVETVHAAQVAVGERVGAERGEHSHLRAVAGDGVGL